MYTGRPTQAGTGSLPRQQPRRSAWGAGPRAPRSVASTGSFLRAAESPDGCRGQEPTGAYHRHPPNVAPSSGLDVGHCAVAASLSAALWLQVGAAAIMIMSVRYARSRDQPP